MATNPKALCQHLRNVAQRTTALVNELEHGISQMEERGNCAIAPMDEARELLAEYLTGFIKNSVNMDAVIEEVLKNHCERDGSPSVLCDFVYLPIHGGVSRFVTCNGRPLTFDVGREVKSFMDSNL